MQVSRITGFFSLMLGLVLLSWGCAHSEIDPNSPDDQFGLAEEAFEDERYLIAIEKYRDIKSRFPYSKRATDAELRIADAFFAQESFIEAESAYEIFRELHPTNPKSDYVQYRIGLSYFMQIPENPARDLSAAHRAIAEFNSLIRKFPSSDYVSKAKEHIEASKKRLGEYENYVADFYFARQHFLSASYRYAALLQEYGNLGYDEEALYRLGECYFQVKMFSNAKSTLGQLLQRFPESRFRSQIVSRLGEIEKAQTP